MHRCALASGTGVSKISIMQSHGLQPQPNGNARIRVHPPWPVLCATSIRITRLDAGLSNRPDVNYRLTAPPNHRSIHLTHMSLFRFLSEYCTLNTVHTLTHTLSLSLSLFPVYHFIFNLLSIIFLMKEEQRSWLCIR